MSNALIGGRARKRFLSHAKTQKSVVSNEVIMKIPEVDNASEALTITLTPAELEMLTWLAQKTGEQPESILKDFVADLTCSWRNGGSDVRVYAFSWFQRRGYGDEAFSLSRTAEDWRNES